MDNRIKKMEMRLHELIEDEMENDKDAKRNDLLASQIFQDQEMLHRNHLRDVGGGNRDNPLTYMALNTRISSLMHEFRYDLYLLKHRHFAKIILRSCFINYTFIY